MQRIRRRERGRNGDRLCVGIGPAGCAQVLLGPEERRARSWRWLSVPAAGGLLRGPDAALDTVRPLHYPPHLRPAKHDMERVIPLPRLAGMERRLVLTASIVLMAALEVAVDIRTQRDLMVVVVPIAEECGERAISVVSHAVARRLDRALCAIRGRCRMPRGGRRDALRLRWRAGPALAHGCQVRTCATQTYRLLLPGAPSDRWRCGPDSGGREDPRQRQCNAPMEQSGLPEHPRLPRSLACHRRASPTGSRTSA